MHDWKMPDPVNKGSFTKYNYNVTREVTVRLMFKRTRKAAKSSGV